MRKLLFFYWVAFLYSISSISGQSGNSDCLDYQFKCKSGEKCVDKILQCDGIKDCPDGSDETKELCGKKTCPKGRFRCNYGACVSSKAKCNGRVDCADKSDEENPDCPHLIYTVPTKPCGHQEFKCKSGKCIQMLLICNGKLDCADGSDETVELCWKKKCASNFFRCDYGACIPILKFCDGHRDCADGSDETLNKKCKSKSMEPSYPLSSAHPNSLSNTSVKHSTTTEKGSTYGSGSRNQGSYGALGYSAYDYENSSENRRTTLAPSTTSPLVHSAPAIQSQLPSYISRTHTTSNDGTPMLFTVPPNSNSQTYTTRPQAYAVPVYATTTSRTPSYSAVAAPNYSGYPASSYSAYHAPSYSAYPAPSYSAYAAPSYSAYAAPSHNSYPISYHAPVVSPAGVTPNYSTYPTAAPVDNAVRLYVSVPYASYINFAVFPRSVGSSVHVLAPAETGKLPYYQCLMNRNLSNNDNSNLPSCYYTNVPPSPIPSNEPPNYGTGPAIGYSGSGTLVPSNLTMDESAPHSAASSSPNTERSPVSAPLTKAQHDDLLTTFVGPMINRKMDSILFASPPGTFKDASCKFPDNIGRNFTIKCDKMFCNNENPDTNVVNSGTNVNYFCIEGYKGEKVQADESQCVKGRWYPDITPCLKQCPMLHPRNMDLSCFYKGESVDCEETLPVGTTVRPVCASFYRETLNPYQTIECRTGGQWSNNLFHCIPVCGKVYKTRPKADGEKTQFGEAPWFAAIYKTVDANNANFICAGTIITPYLVLTAAHCFSDDDTLTTPNPENFRVVVSKYSKEFSKIDNRYTATYRVHKVTLQPDYMGESTKYTADIALVQTQNEIILSEAVLPACIAWTSYFNDENENFNKINGQVFSDDNGNSSTYLLTSQLAYIDRIQCLKNLSYDTQQTVSIDKFCAQSKHPGRGSQTNEGGGGFLYADPYNGFYYVAGVVSKKDPMQGSKTLLTDIRQHLTWLDAQRKRVEKEIELKLP